MEVPEDVIAKMFIEALKKGLAKVPVSDIAIESARKWEKEMSRRGKFGSVGEAMMAEKETQGALVKENIRYRAELRENKASKFPNIASILTGGAGSPVSMMGNMQRQASKPFKAAYDYKKA